MQLRSLFVLLYYIYFFTTLLALTNKQKDIQMYLSFISLSKHIFKLRNTKYMKSQKNRPKDKTTNIAQSIINNYNN